MFESGQARQPLRQLVYATDHSSIDRVENKTESSRRAGIYAGDTNNCARRARNSDCKDALLAAH